MHTVVGSMESNIFAERTVVEEDLDDGTFTIVDPARIKDLYKRLRKEDGEVYTDKDIEAECLQLKTLIREYIRGIILLFLLYNIYIIIYINCFLL